MRNFALNLSATAMKLFQRRASQAQRNESGYIQSRFRLVEVFRGGIQCRHARKKDGTAIVKRLGRDIVRPDFLRRGHDFYFVRADKRPEHNHARRGIHGHKIPQSL